MSRAALTQALFHGMDESDDSGDEGLVAFDPGPNEGGSGDDSDTQSNDGIDIEDVLSEMGVPDDEDEYYPQPEDELRARTGHVWYREEPNQRKRKSKANVCTAPEVAVLAPRAKGPKTVLQTWQLFFSDDFLNEHVLEWTNQHQLKRVEENNATSDNPLFYQPYTLKKLKAFIGILYMHGVHKGHGECLSDMWRRSSCQRPFYTGVMSREDFMNILADLRFDDAATRQERKYIDNFAPMRHFWEDFNDCCEKNMIPGMNLTIDEQLVGFRGRSRFRIFNKQKPDKCGMLWRWLCDAHYRYAYRGIPYVGPPDCQEFAQQAKESNTSEALVKRLLHPFKGAGRNVTTDRFYTSVELAESLETDFKTTMVGTILPTRRHIPEELKTVKGREPLSSKFVFSNNVTLVSYLSRTKRNVLALSTQHTGMLMDDEQKKPEIISFYNDTKAGVDAVDQMCKRYTTKLSTRRWPLVCFANALDVGGINSLQIYLLNNPDYGSLKTRCRDKFLQTLAIALVLPYVYERSRSGISHRIDVKMAMEKILQDAEELGWTPPQDDPPAANAMPGRLPRTPKTPQTPKYPRKRCFLCVDEISPTRRSGERKSARSNAVTTQTCSTCGRFVCKKHGSKATQCGPMPLWCWRFR